MFIRVNRILRRDGGAVSAETRAAFMKAVEQMRAAGATVIIDKDILPESFFASVRKVNPQPYRKGGARPLSAKLRTSAIPFRRGI